MRESSQKLSIRSDYVLVERGRGYTVSVDEQAKLLMELAQYCEEVDCRKVLVLGDDTQVGLGPLDIYELGKEIAKHHLQIAVVESHDASSDDVSFLETVAGNRGGPIQFFADQDEAKTWLGVSSR